VHAVTAYPLYASGNCCFITQRYELDAGELVLDLDIETEMVPEGRLCVSEQAVRAMAHELGLYVAGDDVVVDNERLTKEVATLREENQRMRSAVQRILEATRLSKLEDWMVPA